MLRDVISAILIIVMVTVGVGCIMTENTEGTKL